MIVDVRSLASFYRSPCHVSKGVVPFSSSSRSVRVPGYRRARPWPTTSRRIDRKEDVIYGRKFGSALTMDVFTPKANANGAARHLGRQRRLVLGARGDQHGLPRRAAQAGLHGLRGRPRQPAQVHDPRGRSRTCTGPCGSSGIMPRTITSTRTGSGSPAARPAGICR